MSESDERPLSRWRVGDYHFDANNNRLVGEGRDLLLEPKPAALLAYFCQHPGRAIGRDELLSKVWHGQIVSDNSISRAILLLRKALGDDAKTRKYIATIPKLGYRLIAEVTAAAKLGADRFTSRERQTVSPSRWLSIGVGVVFIGMVFGLVWLRPASSPAAQPTRAIVPLSRLAIPQFNGHLASDGESLVYTASDGNWDVIYLVMGSGAEPLPISAPGGHANFATWAHGADFVVYQFTDGDRCEFHRVWREQFEARAAEVIYQCVPGSYSELSLSPDNSTLYFLERATPHSPYGVFAFDLQRQTKKRLSQPVTQGYGNHYVDVHPVSGALLLLSDHAPGKTSIYELEPGSDSFALRRSFDYGLDSAIWSHREGFVVHPSRHPSYQLLETSLNSEVSSVVVSDSRRIASPRRIGGPDATGAEYLFTSYLFNRDIAVSAMESESINSTVMDYLPAISNSGENLAFVSKRSGESQIWIKNLRDGALTPIKPPDPGRRFHDLAWSMDDQQLLANTNTGVLIYSLAEAVFLHNIALPLPAYAVRWHDRQTLSFTHRENDRWQAYLWHLDEGNIEPLDDRWAFVMQNDKKTLFLDQELTTFDGSGQELGSLAQCASALWRYQLRFRLDEEYLYCHAGDAMADLLRFDADMNIERLPDAVHRFEFFSARGGLLASTQVASSHSDLMRTRRSD